MLALLDLVASISAPLGALLGLAVFIFEVWMLIHAATNNGIGTSEKVAWVLVIFFVPCLGSIIYFFVGKPKATP